jgi:tetratricopeptide (TPR) repeat protein
MSRFNEAREVLEQATTLVKEANLSTTHPSLLGIQNVLAVVYSRLGDNVKAESMLRELLVKDEKLFGKHGLQTFTVMNDLGGVLQRQEKFSEAAEMQKEALRRCTEILGEKARFTMRVRNDLGESLRLWGENRVGDEVETARLLEEAEGYHREALRLRVEVLGEETLDTWISMVNYGFVQQSLGKETEALNYFSVLEKLETAAGSNNEVVQRGKQRLDLLDARKTIRDSIREM